MLLLLVVMPMAVFSQQLTQAEYYVDTDPGPGLANAMVAYDGNFSDALESVLKTNAGSWTIGFHKIGIRVKDNSGHWSPAFVTVINVQNPFVVPAIKVAAGECFWDTDPGQGNGTPMLAYDGNFTDAMEAVVKSGFAAPGLGLHVLNVRVKDVNNNWSPLFRTVVSVQNLFTLPSIKISTGECFWDSDPGQGNGTPMLAFDGNFSDALEAVVKSGFAAPALGMHVLNVRVKDVNNHWSPIFRTIVSVQTPFTLPSIKIATAECFWDTDPGQGSGTPMLAFDGNFTDALESVVKAGFAAPGTGMHRLGVRVKDVNNNWGPVFSTVVSVQNPFVVPAIRITAAELFWDSDPGQGNATPMLAFDGNFSDAYESAAKAEQAFYLAQGLHVLNVRAKNAANQWSPVFRTVVYLDSCISNPTVTATAMGPTTFCPGDSVQLVASGTFTNYYWRRNGVPFGGNTSSVYVSQSGNYVVTALDGNGCPATSAVVSVTVANPNATITASGPLTFCQGDSVILDAGSGYSSYNWSTGASSQTITVYSSGTYTVAVSNASGCSDTSAVSSTTVLPVPAVPVITQVMDTLFSSSATGNQWYLNGNPIAGATGSYYVASQTGNYTVVVTGGNGCTSTSSAYAFIFTAVSGVGGPSTGVLLYPNPVLGTSTLLIRSAGYDGTATVIFFDIAGRVVARQETELKEGMVQLTVDRSSFAAGTYFVKVQLEGQQPLTAKFVVQ
jgi:hypothetical protein